MALRIPTLNPLIKEEASSLVGKLTFNSLTLLLPPPPSLNNLTFGAKDNVNIWSVSYRLFKLSAILVFVNEAIYSGSPCTIKLYEH